MSEYLRVAILDMYMGEPNQGMRCINEIVHQFSTAQNLPVIYDVFDVRGNNNMADMSYDVYIGTGGPGSPIDSEGSVWEQKFFALMDNIMLHNNSSATDKKYVFLICHSFQVFCRYYNLGEVCMRKSPSYGVLPIHRTQYAIHEPLLEVLPEPFYAVDSREWQVIHADIERIEAMGGTLLCIEKDRPHIPLVRAAMMIRFNTYMVGTQFHPEADPQGMTIYLNREDKKQHIIEKFGEDKYYQMLDYLEQDDKIILTHNTVLPAFLAIATGITASVV